MKKAQKETAPKKPLKKIKSFNLDDRVYNGLMELIEASGSQINLSSFIDEYLRKLYVYLLEADGVIKKEGSDLPFSYVVYDAREIEYFREPNKDNTRIKNLIWSHEASKKGMPLWEYLKDYVPDEFERNRVI